MTETLIGMVLFCIISILGLGFVDAYWEERRKLNRIKAIWLRTDNENVTERIN